jgi:hypothetical protein
MVPKGNLFRSLQHLDQASSAERQAARLRRQQQSSGEILQTFLAYRLADAAEKMGLGIAIGDPLTLVHEPTNEWDPNAVKVFWKEQWIGFIPKDMAALIAAEVPEARTGLEAVVTGLGTTSLRDAFRLQISIPLPKARRRLRELGVTSSFAWDFDRSSGTDKLRLVINCTETAFRELQQLLRSRFDVGKCGYSYYPTQDGRHYPWYLSLTDAEGRAPSDPEAVEQLIRSWFGEPSESTRRRERQRRQDELEKKQAEISKRLETSRAEERRLRKEFESKRDAWKQRAEEARKQGNEAIDLAQSVEAQLKEELQFKDEELKLAWEDNQSLEDEIKELSNELTALKDDLDYLQQQDATWGAEQPGLSPYGMSDGKGSEPQIAERLLTSLRNLAGRERLTPRQCLELVSEELCPGHLLVLDSAWKSADQSKRFELSDQLFDLLWVMATGFREQKLSGAPDRIAGQVFGSSYAARESTTTEGNPKAIRDRTFSYGGKKVVMWQHLKIGSKDSENRTLRIHFTWDDELAQVVIGHCGKHLHNPNHS